jgi:hypothetical protein
MQGIPPSDDAAKSHAARPGRRRTWWHPLFARTLKWALHGDYEVRDEVSLGELPLRLDVRFCENATSYKKPRAASFPSCCRC